MTQKQLLRTVWGEKAESQAQYLRVYITYLRKKLEPNADFPRLIKTEVGDWLSPAGSLTKLVRKKRTWERRWILDKLRPKRRLVSFLISRSDLHQGPCLSNDEGTSVAYRTLRRHNDQGYLKEQADQLKLH